MLLRILSPNLNSKCSLFNPCFSQDTVLISIRRLQPFMQKIADSLVAITRVWSDITQGLNDVETWNDVIGIPEMLDSARPELINAWTRIKDATQRYVDIITS
jgi:hypothetical protein